MKSQTIVHQKLVRDLIPNLLEKNNIKCITNILDNQTYGAALRKKLLEEVFEYLSAPEGEQEQLEELADIMEIIHALIAKDGHDLESLEKTRQEKFDAKGGFNQRIFLEKTHDPSAAASITPNCLFCGLEQREDIEIIAKFKRCFAIKDAYPVSTGHILIIPFEHTENWFTAKPEVKQEMMHALELIKLQLDAEYKPDGYNIGANCGKDAGQSVMHLHLHLIPHCHGDMEDPKGGVRGVIPSRQKY